jgi:hypothetical protein
LACVGCVAHSETPQRCCRSEIGFGRGANYAALPSRLKVDFDQALLISRDQRRSIYLIIGGCSPTEVRRATIQEMSKHDS